MVYLKKNNLPLRMQYKQKMLKPKRLVHKQPSQTCLMLKVSYKLTEFKLKGAG